MTERGYEFLKKAGYYAVRRGERGENPLNPTETTDAFSLFNLGVRGIGDANSTSERNAWIDLAVSNKTWLIEMWHDVSAEGGNRYQEISTEMADAHMAYIAMQKKQGNIWVASYQDAIKYLWDKQYAMVDAKCIENEITIVLTCDREILPKEIFNDPLTLLVEVPNDWKYVCAEQNGFALPVERDETTGKLIVNAVPDGNDIVLSNIELGE